MIDINPTMLHYIADGIIGGLAYALVQKFGYQDKDEIVRRLVLGGIFGYIVFISNLPNSLTALSLGYLGIDAVEPVLKSAAEKLGGKKDNV